MTLKHPLFLALLFTLSLGMSAQSVHFKFGGGLSSHYGKAETVGAFKIGVGYEIEFNQHWSFTPGLEIYGKGWKDPNETVFVFDDDHQQMFHPETELPSRLQRIVALHKIMWNCLYSSPTSGAQEKHATSC